MSFSVASYFTCSPGASSASATSASSPTEGAPPCCHGASPLSTPLHRKTNRKPRPLLLHTRCGAVPSVADRWPSSNDSRRHNSNSVLHRSWSRLHEITHPHTPHCRRASERLAEVCLRYIKTSSLRPSTRLCTDRPPATPAVPDDSGELLHSRSLHSISISPASAAPAASF